MARGDKNTAQSHTTRSQSAFALFSGPADVAQPRLIFIFSVFALTVIGLVMVFSSSSIEAISEGANPWSAVIRQAAVAGASVVICVVIVRFIPYYYWLDQLLRYAWAGVMILLLLCALMGTVGLGARRWIVIGPVNFQPSEFAKVAIILMAARLWYEYRLHEASFEQTMMRFAVGVALPLGIILVAQSDLGTTMICLVGLLAVLWIGEAPIHSFAVAVLLVFVGGVIAIAASGYRGSRFAFLDPYADPYGSGYQLIHSFYAFGEGGLLGVGLGNSREKYLYLPEAETDFIFAIIGEEMGLIGAVVIVLLFCAVLYSGLKIARNAPDSFGMMIAGGCTIMLVFQAFLNICCVLGMFPTTGKPLPFISSGGSAMLGSYLLVAIVLSVSFSSGADSGVFDRRRADLRVMHAERDQSSRGGSRSMRSDSTRAQSVSRPARQRRGR